MMASISSKYGTHAAINGGDCFRLSEDLEEEKDKFYLANDLSIKQNAAGGKRVPVIYDLRRRKRANPC